MPDIHPSRVLQAVMAAQSAGNAAAKVKLGELQSLFGEREQYDYAAGAVLHLSIRPSS